MPGCSFLFFEDGFGGLNSGPCAYKASTFTDNYSPRSSTGSYQCTVANKIVRILVSWSVMHKNVLEPT